MSTVQTAHTAEDLGGLRVEDGDMLNMLVKSLPSAVRDYALMHAQTATYPGFKQAARWYENQHNQHRLFKELNPGKKAVFGVVGTEETGDPSSSAEGNPEESGTVNAVNSYNGAVKCTKCGRKGHLVQNCTVDMSRTKCYNCGAMGRVSLNCKSRQKALPGKGALPVTKGSGKSKGKGNSKGGGKKGKMFAVCDDSGVGWYSECEAATAEPAEGPTQENADSSHEASASAVLVLSSLLPSSGVTKQEFVKNVSPTRASKDIPTWDSEALYELDWSKVGQKHVASEMRQLGTHSDSCRWQRYSRMGKAAAAASVACEVSSEETEFTKQKYP
eukprot:s4870_g3.t1